MKKDGKTTGMRKVDTIILMGILLIALFFRLYNVTIPLADFHSWRQADTAAVARNMARDGIDLLHPKYDDLSSIQTGIDNPQGYRFVEFPLYNSIFAALYKTAPLIPIEVYGRIVTIFFTLISIALVYYFGLKESGRVAAIAGSLLFATFPFFVYYTRVVLPDPIAVSLALISIFFLYVHLEQNNKVKKWLLYLFSMIFFAAAMLVKPPALFFGIVLLYLFSRRYTISFLTRIDMYVFFFLSFVPLILWRYYILSFPEGIPSSDWLITSVNTYQGLQNIFFKPAFFRWIFFERINNLILGGYTTALFILGVLKRPKTLFIYSFLGSSLAYLLIFQGGNVQHEYYQIMILPTLALFVGQGVDFVFKNQKMFVHLFISSIIIATIYVMSFYFSYFKVKDYYGYSRELVQTANIIRALTTQGDRVVTDTVGDTTILYLMDRKGAPAVFKDLNELKNKGYTHFYTTKKDVVETIKKETEFKTIFENEKFALIQL